VIRASFGKTVARSTLIGGLALLAVPAVAGCEAGFNAPTLEFHAASGGAHTTVNGIQISNAFVLGAPTGTAVPKGSSASLFVSLFNNGSNNDKLVSVTAPDNASSVTIQGGGVAVPAESAADLTGPKPVIVLKGLTRPLSGGMAITMTFDFSAAGTVTLSVPVEPSSFYYSTYSPPPTPSAKAKSKAKSSSTATPTATATPTSATTGTPTAAVTPTPTVTPTT
jgi:copper(I)-binding protein